MGKRILFIATGGTIASEVTALGLQPGLSARGTSARRTGT